MNTYFNYQAEIKSLDLSRAISLPKGVGPFTGFGYGEIIPNQDNTGATASYSVRLLPTFSPTVGSYPTVEGLLPNNSYLQPLTKDIQSHHKMITSDKTLPRLNSQVTVDMGNDDATFGLVTKDGFICTNSGDNWVIPISNWTNSQSAPKEVVVVARHSYISEAVDNPVTLEAYASNYGIISAEALVTGSSEYSDINSFYELYRRSMDIYYNRSDNPNFALNNPLSSSNGLKLKLSYEDLLGYVQAKMYTQISDWSDLTLVGIYGKGSFINEGGSTEEEPFAIVPYEGKWPMDLPFNTAVMNGIAKDLYNINRIQEGFPYIEGSESLNIKAYIDKRLEEISSSLSTQTAQVIPSGLICLWDQSEIPEGWHIYEEASGRIVIGFVSGGIPAGPNGTNLLTELKQMYPNSTPQNSDWQMEITAQNLPKHLHAFAIGLTGWKDEDRGDNPVPADWKNYNPSLTTPSSSSMVINNWSDVGMMNGAIKTGPNLTVTDSGAAVSSSNQSQSDSLSLQKILPSIALYYIQKD